MIKAEQIYQATDDGLDIIIALYPDALLSRLEIIGSEKARI